MRICLFSTKNPQLKFSTGFCFLFFIEIVPVFLQILAELFEFVEEACLLLVILFVKLFAECSKRFLLLFGKILRNFKYNLYHLVASAVTLELLDSLAMSGIANEVAGGSAPTSGSEHLISHALDKMLEQPQLHGIQVGIATYLMSVVQDHRYKRVNTIFTQTGFWDFVKTLEMRHVDFEQAIDLAPSIKPFRHTYLHEQEYRDRAKEVLVTDEKLKEILV